MLVFRLITANRKHLETIRVRYEPLLSLLVRMCVLKCKYPIKRRDQNIII